MRAGFGVQQHAVFAQCDQGRTDTFGKQNIASAARIFQRAHFNSGQFRGFRLVWRDVVTQAKDVFRQMRGRCWIEDGDDARWFGNFQSPNCRIKRLLKLCDEHTGATDEGGVGVNIRHADQSRCTGADDNGVVACRFFQKDESRASVAFRRLNHRKLHAGFLPYVARHIGERVFAEACNQRHISAKAPGGNGLIGTFATRPQRKAAA